MKFEMTSLRTRRRPNYFSKRRDYQSCFNVEDQGEKTCLKIVGRKIQLHKRRGGVTLHQFDTEAINSEFTLFDIKHCTDDDIKLEREPLTGDEDDVQTKDRLVLKNAGTSDEKSKKLPGEAQLHFTYLNHSTIIKKLQYLSSWSKEIKYTVFDIAL